MGSGSSGLSKGGGGGSSGTSAPKMQEEILTDISDYSGYAGQLARSAQGRTVFTLDTGRGKAFAWVSDHGDEIYLNEIGSTGNRAGSELFAQVAELAQSRKIPLWWTADTASAKNFYDYLGFSPDPALSAKYGNNQYYLQGAELSRLIKRLRR